MKKARLFTRLTLTVMLSILLLVGCKKEDKISSVSLKDYDPNSAIEMAMGDFDYGAHTLIVSYDSGNTEEIALTKEMITPTDIVKFYQIGEHDITVNYGKHSYVFKISVERSSFGELSLPENNVFTYDGKAHTIEVQGDMPANAVVSYPGGNSFVNAGTYDVTAIVSCDGYASVKLTTTVKIERAVYDMSKVKFESKEYVYDGTAHSVKISGTLPAGVTEPTYTINEKFTSSAIEVGEYTVRATFANNNPNYQTIPDMHATLKITPAEYTVDGVDIVFKKENGKVIDGTVKEYDGTSVTFDLSNYNKHSNKVSVAFFVYDKDGNVISNSNKITNIKNAGVYTVKAAFTMVDSKNYKPVDPIICTFEVLKTDYPTLENIRFIPAQQQYNGKEHSIKIEGELPKDVTVSYEYYLDGVLVKDNDNKPAKAVINAGRYTVKAVFAHTNQNCKEIPSISTTLDIEKIKVDISMLGFTNASKIEYSGTPYELKYTTWKDANFSEFDILEYSAVTYYVYDESLKAYVEMGENAKPTEIGSYRTVITVSVIEKYQVNYVLRSGNNTQIIISDFEIRKKEIALPKVSFQSEAATIYTGAAQAVDFTCNANEDIMTVSTAYFERNDLGAYVAMDNNAIPTNAGSYKFVITLTLKDAQHCVFANEKSNVEYSFEFVIEKIVIEISSLGLANKAEHAYTGTDLKTKSIDAISEEIKKYFDCVWVQLGMNIAGEYQIQERAIEVGNYSVNYTLKLKDDVNCVFSDGQTTLYVTHIFDIVSGI